MAGILLSEAEKTFLLHGVEEDYRSDGRSRTDYRPIELETDVVSHASGSARLRLANTDVLVGIKTEIDVPNSNCPDFGKIEFFVDCSANATPEFEGRGGEQLATQISCCLQRAYQSSQAFDLRQLSILRGKQCWKLYVDILILECGGNLYDAVSIAVKGALFNTRIPCVKAALMDGGNVDLQLSDDPYDSKRLNIGTAPLLVTLCKIGEHCVADPTGEEQKCSIVSLIVAVSGDPHNYCAIEGIDVDMTSNGKGRLCTIATHGPGSFHPQTLLDAMKQGRLAALTLDSVLGEALLREERESSGKKKNSYGFLK